MQVFWYRIPRSFHVVHCIKTFYTFILSLFNHYWFVWNRTSHDFEPLLSRSTKLTKKCKGTWTIDNTCPLRAYHWALVLYLLLLLPTVLYLVWQSWKINNLCTKTNPIGTGHFLQLKNIILLDKWEILTKIGDNLNVHIGFIYSNFNIF